LIARGGIEVFDETGELIGCENTMADRAVNAEFGQLLRKSVEKAVGYCATLGPSSFTHGNADGGLTTRKKRRSGVAASPVDSIGEVRAELIRTTDWNGISSLLCGLVWQRVWRRLLSH